MSDEFDGIVRYRTGCFSFVLILLLGAVIVFLIAAFDAEVLDDFSNRSTRYARAVDILKPFEFGGVNVAALLLAGYLIFETIKFGRKMADPIAVRLEEDRLVFHPAINRDPLVVSAVVSWRLFRKGLRSEIGFTTKIGTVIWIKNVEESDAVELENALSKRLQERPQDREIGPDPIN